MPDRIAPAFYSIDDALDKIAHAVKAIRLMDDGLRPFKYVYYFDDRKDERTGPMKGTIYAKDAADAKDSVGRDSNGYQYAYDIEITPCPWHKDD